MRLDITKAQVADYDNISEYTIPAQDTDGTTETKETPWLNSHWLEQYGAFLNVPEYQNALMMKGIWNTGKGWTAQPYTTSVLNAIRGWGKDTFDDIILNLDVMSMASGDSFAHIITHNNKKLSEGGKIINLKPLNPGSIKYYVNDEGIITRYEQISRTKKVFRTFDPEEIFHLSYQRMADQIHGISIYEKVKKIITADEEMFEVMRKVMRQQAIPFIIFKYKTDNEATISNIITKIRSIREKYDDLHIPDDENLLSWEVVQISPSQIIMTWRDDLRNKFYRAVGLPQIVPGGGGASTDSDARVIYLAFEQLVKQRQLYLEKQIKSQLGFTIKFNAPTTMMELIGNDENKDGSAPFNMQAGEMNAMGEQQ